MELVKKSLIHQLLWHLNQSAYAFIQERYRYQLQRISYILEKIDVIDEDKKAQIMELLEILPQAHILLRMLQQ